MRPKIGQRKQQFYVNHTADFARPPHFFHSRPLRVDAPALTIGRPKSLIFANSAPFCAPARATLVSPLACSRRQWRHWRHGKTRPASGPAPVCLARRAGPPSIRRRQGAKWSGRATNSALHAPTSQHAQTSFRCLGGARRARRAATSRRDSQTEWLNWLPRGPGRAQVGPCASGGARTSFAPSVPAAGRRVCVPLPSATLSRPAERQTDKERLSEGGATQLPPPPAPPGGELRELMCCRRR